MDSELQGAVQVIKESLDLHDEQIERLQKSQRTTMYIAGGAALVSGLATFMTMRCIKAVAQAGQAIAQINGFLSEAAPMLQAMAATQEPRHAAQARPMKVEPRVAPETNGAAVAEPVVGPESATPPDVAEAMASEPSPIDIDQFLQGELDL